MFKWLAKMFIPSAATLAEYAADKIQKTVNDSTADTQAKIARYSTFAAEASEIAGNLSRLAADGKITQMERDTLAAMIEPVMERLLTLI